VASGRGVVQLGGSAVRLLQLRLFFYTHTRGF
jgi:hypothetical protein